MAHPSILTNIHAQNAQAGIKISLENLKTTSIRTATGKQITEAKDGPASLSIGIGLSTDESTQKAALTTTGQAQSILSIMDGGLDQISSILAKLKSLASQANSGAMGASELTYIKSEMDELLNQINTTVDNVVFNGSKLLDGAYIAKAFQVGLTSTDIINIDFSTAATQAGLGVSAIDVTTDVPGANNALDTAIDTVKGMRANVGALQSRFSYAAANLETTISNTSAAKSLYLDADFAKESTNLAAYNTMLQAGIATLAQMNQLPANLLKLVS